MIDHQTLLDFHLQRAANLRAAMLLIELGAGVRVDAGSVAAEPLHPCATGQAPYQ